ncbi:hypothetical protein ACWDRX_23730, partial [Streptomyces nigra]
MGQPQQPGQAEAEAGAAGAGAPPLRVGMVGYAFMGAAHSQGWRTAGRVFDLPRTVKDAGMKTAREFRITELQAPSRIR